MDADGQVGLIHIPEVLEDIFGEKARVCEDKRRLVLADLLVKLRDRPCRGMPAPGNARFLRKKDLDIGLRALLALDQFNGVEVAPGCEPGTKGLGVGNRCRKPRTAHVGSERLEPGERKREQVAALARRKGVNFVDDNALEAAEQLRRIGIGEQ